MKYIMRILLSGHIHRSFLPYNSYFNLSRDKSFRLNFLSNFKTKFVTVIIR